MRCALLAIGFAALVLTGCGSMSDYEEPQTPASARAQVGVTDSDEVAAQRAADRAKADSEARIDEFNDTDPSALAEFKPELDPYGSWVEDPTYGTVWVPSSTSVGSDFAPYVSNGHWATDENDQYLWVSDYDNSFGWVTFHYGRWTYADNLGWAWIPGRRYAPAWVVWRAGDPGYGYVGWAPAPPYYYWHGGSVMWLGVYPQAPYVFCSTGYMFSPHVGGYIVDRGHVAAVAAATRPYGSSGSASHVLATPQRGPSVQSGHIAASSWPAQHVASNASTARYASPAAMGRPGSAMSTASSPRFASNPYSAGARGDSSRSLGVTRPSYTQNHALAPSRSTPSYGGSPHYSPSPYSGHSYSLGSSYSPGGHSYSSYGHSYGSSGAYGGGYGHSFAPGGAPATSSTPAPSHSHSSTETTSHPSSRGGGRGGGGRGGGGHR